MLYYVFQSVTPPLEDGELLEDRENPVFTYGFISKDKIKNESIPQCFKIIDALPTNQVVGPMRLIYDETNDEFLWETVQ